MLVNVLLLPKCGKPFGRPFRAPYPNDDLKVWLTQVDLARFQAKVSWDEPVYQRLLSLKSFFILVLTQFIP